MTHDDFQAVADRVLPEGMTADVKYDLRRHRYDVVIHNGKSATRFIVDEMADEVAVSSAIAQVSDGLRDPTPTKRGRR